MNHRLKQFIALAALASLVVTTFTPFNVSAAQIINRKLELKAGATDGGSKPGGVVRHKFYFRVPTAGNVGSIKFQYCTSASGACTTPTGLVTTAATLAGGDQTGATGFTMVNATNGTPYITRTAANIPAATDVTYDIATITNPTNAAGETFFVRVTTYASTDTTGASTDTGTVAAATARQIDVLAHVDEILVFCVYTGANCAAGGATVDLGTLTTTTTGTGTSKMDAGTNAGTGYVITYTGPTLTSGANTIAACTAGCTSAVNTGQYGLNLKDNTTPDIGAEITAASNGTNLRGQAIAPYATVDTFRYVPGTTGEAVANSGNATLGPTDSQTYTVSYIANISASQPAGDYVSTVTYICTATY